MSSKAVIEFIEKVCPVKACELRPKDGEPVYCFGCSRLDRKTDFSMLISTKDELTERILFKGSHFQHHYSGDGIDCKKGDVVLVSRAKKVQLFKDFPGLWDEPKKEKKVEPSEEPKIKRGRK